MCLFGFCVYIKVKDFLVNDSFILKVGVGSDLLSVVLGEKKMRFDPKYYTKQINFFNFPIILLIGHHMQ